MGPFVLVAGTAPRLVPSAPVINFVGDIFAKRELGTPYCAPHFTGAGKLNEIAFFSVSRVLF